LTYVAPVSFAELVASGDPNALVRTACAFCARLLQR
jgi:hypothetical protein